MAKPKKSTAPYAVIGIIIAIVGCIATGLLALVEGTIALQIIPSTNADAVKVWLSISAAVLVVGLAVYAILAPDSVRRFFTGRQARYGSNALILAVAFFVTLFVINMLAFQNPCPWKSCDVTEDKQHTLAPETLQALDNLPDKVNAIAFYSGQSPRDAATQLLNDFKSHSNGKFDYHFSDPNSDPLLAKQYGVTGDGKIVLTMGKASETASYADETELDRALIRLISPEARVVYFLTGHGEPDINGSGDSALSRARETLESKNYTVKTLNLAATNKVPDDAKAIIIAGPQNPLLDQEVTLLKAYASKGGSLVVMEDPTPFTKVGTDPDPLADYLNSDWGITLDNDVVIDQTSNQPLYAISASYNTTQNITQHMTNVTIMPQARTLTISQSLPQDVTTTPLILTSQQSWGETDLAGMQSNQQIKFDQATDIPGPLTLAATGENSSSHGRVVVFGNSIFATDKGFDAY
ncbi:MAG TPA: GldG family protein, partial [Anaerolineales bacterium]|nr:GldG family protein [Anaerolineales bacterium]